MPGYAWIIIPRLLTGGGSGASPSMGWTIKEGGARSSRPDPSLENPLRERDDSYSFPAVASCHIEHIDDLTVSERR